jgi:hypothetical protein
VTFPNGKTARIVKRGDDAPAGDGWAYYLGDAKSNTGTAFDASYALAKAWTACLDAPAPLDMTPAQVEAVVAEVNDAGTVEACKIVRRLLKARTGVAWSVKRHTGTASGWFTITAPPKRCPGDFGYMTPADIARLSVVLEANTGRCVHNQGETVPPTNAARAAIVRLICG